MSQRVRVVGGPWPERIGCVGATVPDGPDHYPWHKLPKGFVVVALDRDPLDPDRTDRRTPRWSCVMALINLEVIP